MEEKKQHAHHGFTHSHMEWHKDGSATVHHVHHEGPHKDVKHAATDLDHVHDSLEENMGTPNAGEQASVAPAAAPAPSMPGGPAAPMGT